MIKEIMIYFIIQFATNTPEIIDIFLKYTFAYVFYKKNK